MSKLVRKNIFMSKQIAEWYEEQSEKTGMSQSNIMVMALHEFMTQQQALLMMNQYGKIELELKQQSQKIKTIQEQQEAK